MQIKQKSIITNHIHSKNKYICHKLKRVPTFRSKKMQNNKS